MCGFSLSMRLRNNATYKDAVCKCSYERKCLPGDSEPFIVYMDPVSIIQQIESSFDEPVKFVPSRPLSISSDSFDGIKECDCGKCDNCELKEDEYYCDHQHGGCPYSCIECDSSNDKKLKFLEKNGYSYDEIWNLDSTVARFMAPRLREFMKDINGFPPELKSADRWKRILKSISIYLRLKIDCQHYSIALDSDCEFTKMKSRIFNNGRENFKRYFEHLWN